MTRWHSSPSALRNPSLSTRVPANTWPAHINEWVELTQTKRANGLLVASDDVVRAVLSNLRPTLPRPMLECREGTPWQGRQLATLLLDDLIVLSPTEQLSLFMWMDGDGGGCQVISFACLPVFTLVEQGGFLAPLYYRLNCLYADYAEP